MRDPDTLDDISKERFEGTVLKAISKNVRKIKKEPGEERGGGGTEGGQTLLAQVQKESGKVLQFVTFPENKESINTFFSLSDQKGENR